jgi:hypothetical protein
MDSRRLTRLTNAFSKKWENFCAAVALNFAYYNSCRVHRAVRMTPQWRRASSRARGRLLNWSSAVEKSEYLERLKLAVEQMRGCRAQHAQTVPMHEVFQGQTVWQGDVEVFNVAGHPKEQRCYAWSSGRRDDEKFTAILEVPPVNDAVTAVRVSIVANAKEKRRT